MKKIFSLLGPAMGCGEQGGLQIQDKPGILKTFPD